MRRLFLTALLIMGCNGAQERHGGGGTGVGNGSGNGSGNGTGGGDASAGCTKMDILFIVDNSGSMEEEQTNLAQNFPKFIDVLNNYMTGAGVPLDYHVGLTTTSLSEGAPPIPIPIPLPMGDDGALHDQASCGMTRPWIERTDNDPAGQFSCVAKVGTDGSGHEQPLSAAKLALNDRIADGKNAGFLRPDALLAVVILTDEDDQSTDASSMDIPVDQFIANFDTVKSGHDRWATAVIAGPTACMSTFGNAEEAVRLKDYVMKTGKQAVFSSICDGDLAKSLGDALMTFTAACDSFPIGKPAASQPAR